MALRRFSLLARGAASRTITGMLYLILALVWLTCGVGILAYQAATGDQHLSLHLAGATFSSGWLMLVLSAYNLLRWWTPAAPRSRASRTRTSTSPTIRRRATDFSLASRPRIGDTNNCSETPIPPAERRSSTQPADAPRHRLDAPRLPCNHEGMLPA
jgi:hypothetical protein